MGWKRKYDMIDMDDAKSANRGRQMYAGVCYCSGMLYCTMFRRLRARCCQQGQLSLSKASVGLRKEDAHE